MDRDGFISNGELYLVLKMMVGNNLKVPGGPIPREDLLSSAASRISNCSKSSTRRSWRQIRMGARPLQSSSQESLTRRQ
jgi:hypothetical protein